MCPGSGYVRARLIPKAKHVGQAGLVLGTYGRALEVGWPGSGQSLIGDLFPPHQRARAMGIFMLGLPAGLCLAYFSAGAIGAAFGWRAAFLFACFPGLLFAWLALRIPESVRGALDAARSVASTDAAVRSPYAAVLKLPTMWWIILSGIFHNFNMYAINAFQTPFLQRFHEMGLRQASNVSAISVGAVGAIGLLAGGWVADRMSAKRRDGRLLCAASSMAIAASEAVPTPASSTTGTPARSRMIRRL